MSLNYGLKPRCECGKSFGQHLRGKGCGEYKARRGLAQVSENQKADQEIFNAMRRALLALQHELTGGTYCEAAGKLDHMCYGQLVLDHVNLKKTMADKFSLTNCQILCEVGNILKGSKRTDFRSAKMKKAIEERFPGIWETEKESGNVG